jgi:hypothetical protein
MDGTNEKITTLTWPEAELHNVLILGFSGSFAEMWLLDVLVAVPSA